MTTPCVFRTKSKLFTESTVISKIWHTKNYIRELGSLLQVSIFRQKFKNLLFLKFSLFLLHFHSPSIPLPVHSVGVSPSSLSTFTQSLFVKMFVPRSVSISTLTHSFIIHRKTFYRCAHKRHALTCKTFGCNLLITRWGPIKRRNEGKPIWK